MPSLVSARTAAVLIQWVATAASATTASNRVPLALSALVRAPLLKNTLSLLSSGFGDIPVLASGLHGPLWVGKNIELTGLLNFVAYGLYSILLLCFTNLTLFITYFVLILCFYSFVPG